MVCVVEEQSLELPCERAQVYKFQVYAFLSCQRSDDIVRLYELGVQDVIVDSCEAQELRARLQRTLRSSKPVCSDRILCGNLQLWPNFMRAELSGRVLELSALEFRLLQFFVLHRNEVLSRAVILEQVWKGVHVSARTIDSHIGILRKKLSGFKGDFEAVYGVGYALRPEPEIIHLDECDRIATCPYAISVREQS